MQEQLAFSTPFHEVEFEEGHFKSSEVVDGHESGEVIGTPPKALLAFQVSYSNDFFVF